MENFLLFISMIIVLIRRAIDNFFETPAAIIKPTPTVKPGKLFPAAPITSYPDPNQLPWTSKVAHLERHIIHPVRSSIPRDELQVLSRQYVLSPTAMLCALVAMLCLGLGLGLWLARLFYKPAIEKVSAQLDKEKSQAQHDNETHSKQKELLLKGLRWSCNLNKSYISTMSTLTASYNRLKDQFQSYQLQQIQMHQIKADEQSQDDEYDTAVTLQALSIYAKLATQVAKPKNLLEDLKKVEMARLRSSIASKDREIESLKSSKEFLRKDNESMTALNLKYSSIMHERAMTIEDRDRKLGELEGSQPNQPLANQPLANQPLANQPLANQPFSFKLDRFDAGDAIRDLTQYTCKEPIKFQQSISTGKAEGTIKESPEPGCTDEAAKKIQNPPSEITSKLDAVQRTIEKLDKIKASQDANPSTSGAGKSASDPKSNAAKNKKRNARRRGAGKGEKDGKKEGHDDEKAEGNKN